MQAKHDAAAPVWIFMLFCLINYANYFDRSIIPSAPAQFQYFIQTVTSSNDMGTLLGLLAASFIMSFTISIPLFGYLAMFVQPFRLVAIGLAAWCVVVVLCSLSKDAQSFELLLAGRILSGVGEASFQCVAPPFIHDYAPPHQQTLWFGIFTVSSVLGGGAAINFAMSGLGLFANLLLIGLKVFSNETDANVMTGIPGSKKFFKF
ncbi:unnamed protein product [Aphanomyces euteiches]